MQLAHSDSTARSLRNTPRFRHQGRLGRFLSQLSYLVFGTHARWGKRKYCYSAIFREGEFGASNEIPEIKIRSPSSNSPKVRKRGIAALGRALYSEHISGRVKKSRTFGQFCPAQVSIYKRTC